jgi:hypothetical protein
LLKKEVIFKNNLETIFGKRPFKTEEVFQSEAESTGTTYKKKDEEE